MRHGSLFTGIGGFDLAAEWMGWENIFNCEINDACKKWLQYRWSETLQHADIKQTDFREYRGSIDIISGGDPCQCNSVICKQVGTKSNYFILPEYFRVIDEVRPGWLVNENVRGSISNGVLDRKISDLESVGYTCWPPVIIPASFAGASHRRERVWLVAYSPERRLQRWNRQGPCRQRETKVRPITALVQNKNGTIVPLPEFLQGNDGIPGWVDEIQGFGNGICPQVAHQIFRAIEKYNNIF